MRLSTSTNIYSHDAGVNYAVRMEDSVWICAEAGYRFLDANLCGQCRDGMPMSDGGWEDWICGVRSLADSLGVRFTQAHAPFVTFEEAVIGPNGEWTGEARMEEMMERCLRAAELLGAEWMVVHPLTVCGSGGYSPRKSAEYNRRYYGRWGERFARKNVGMAIENMSGNWYFYQYANTAEELLELVAAIDNPMVKICLDTGHAHLADQDPAGMLRMVGGELRALHVDDNHGGKKDEHLAPFCGTIDWGSVMTALGELDYQYDFSFEIHHLAHLYPKEVQAGMVRFSYALGNYLLSKMKGDR